MSTLAPNPAYGAGLPLGWTVQNALGNNNGGGDQSLVDGGAAPTSGLGFSSPSRNGLLAWTFDPLLAIAGGSPATGTQIASKVYWPGGNMTNLWVYCTAKATTQTHGWLAVYDGSGTQWAATADLGATALTTSPAANEVPLSAVTPVPSGWYYVWASFVFSVGTYTFSKWGGSTVTAARDLNISAAPYDFNYDSTTVSALPASLAWGTGWATDSTYMTWFGIS